MRSRLLPTKLEEIRQARTIHGGVVRMCVAALGVRLSRVKIPSRRLRLLIFRTVYGKKYGTLNEAEFEKPMEDYPSLNALFTRGVRPEFRPIAPAADQLLCPCDGRVQEIGRLDRGRIIAVKGIEYTLESLLPGIDVAPLINGRFGVFFLSPSDCHRVFSPQDARIEEVIHVPGYRLLVHPPFQRREYPVFTLNERMLIRLSTPLGRCVLVLVAGWGVGNITLPFDPSFQPRRRTIGQRRYNSSVVVKRGEWIATFELGSTAILITEPTGSFTPLVARDQKVKYGEPVFFIAH
jgi:phosphatidylserine decarboxylase